MTDAPLGLFVFGRLDSAPTVAIVGSRKATPYGRQVATLLAEELGRAGSRGGFRNGDGASMRRRTVVPSRAGDRRGQCGEPGRIASIPGTRWAWPGDWRIGGIVDRVSSGHATAPPPFSRAQPDSGGSLSSGRRRRGGSEIWSVGHRPPGFRRGAGGAGSARQHLLGSFGRAEHPDQGRGAAPAHPERPFRRHRM